MKFQKVYYWLRPFIPRRVQIILRRYLVIRKKNKTGNIWPINPAVSPPPPGFTGWPSGKKFALLITHDVETARGRDRCLKLMDTDLEFGFLSSFNFVPLRYPVPARLRQHLTQNGYEIGIHGLKHDGKLYNSFRIFSERAQRINAFLREWQAIGFRSPSMHHNLEWLHLLNIEYDSSTFDTDPFEPQANGTGKIFPFWVPGGKAGEGYIELPYTLPQDFTLFVMMQEYTIETWVKKLDWLVKKGGMVLVGVHPDYLNFGPGKDRFDEYPVQRYQEFLTYVKSNYQGQYWNPLPRTLARFWKKEVETPGD